jgi:hypothetical protein
MPDNPVHHPQHYGRADDPYETVKVCSECEETKALADYPPDNRRKDKHGSKCRVCSRKIREAYYQRYPDKEAERRLKNTAAGNAWYQRNRATQLTRIKWYRIQKLYSLTFEQYMALLKDQGGRCSICRSDDPGRGNGYFLVDHDHETGHIRGLLCHTCNLGLGLFGDDPRRMREAAKYVERYRQRHQTDLLQFPET